MATVGYLRGTGTLPASLIEKMTVVTSTATRVVRLDAGTWVDTATISSDAACAATAVLVRTTAGTQWTREGYVTMCRKCTGLPYCRTTRLAVVRELGILLLQYLTSPVERKSSRRTCFADGVMDAASPGGRPHDTIMSAVHEYGMVASTPTCHSSEIPKTHTTH